MSNVDPVDLAANFSTGGLYGVAKGAEKAIDTGKVGAGAADALASYGTFGSIAQPTLGTRNALLAESLIAGGALGAAGPGAFSTAGFGAAAPGATPYYAGAGLMDLGHGAMVGVDAAGNPLYQGATLAGKGMMTGAEAAAAGIPSLTAGGVAGALGSGGGQAGALLGANTALQGGQAISGLLGGSSPLSMPTGGAYPGGGGGGLSAAQQASLSAMNSEAHKGLAPTFENRMKGRPAGPGIAGEGWSQ